MSTTYVYMIVNWSSRCQQLISIRLLTGVLDANNLFLHDCLRF